MRSPFAALASSSSAGSAERSLEQERLRNAYLRRQAVCDRLLDVAEQTNNTALKEEAERLDDLAWKLYQEQSTRLLSSSTGVDPDRPVPAGVLPGSSTKPRVPGRFRGGESALGGDGESASREGER